MALRTLRLPVVAATALALAAPCAASAQTATDGLAAPIAAGNSAGNMQLSGKSKWLMTRWVARATGSLRALHLRIQANGSTCRLDGKTGYGAGDGGSWHVTTHPVLADGRPDMSRTLATQDFRPCTGSAPTVDVRQGIVRLAMNIDVTRGTEYATIVRNTASNASTNFTSENFLYASSGIAGANGRNERSPDAGDAYYGLDPRELVGYSSDGGATWSLPGGQYGQPGGRSFLPTYIQEYASGLFTGQPYYYATSPVATRTMVFDHITSPWTIRALGAYTPTAGAGDLSLFIDGQLVTRADVATTRPAMLRASITPVTVQPGQTVKVQATGILIQSVVADTAWGRLIGMHLSSQPWHIDGGTNFSAAAPVYALPAYGQGATLTAARHRTRQTGSGHHMKHRKHHRKHRRHRKHHGHPHHSQTVGAGMTIPPAAPSHLL